LPGISPKGCGFQIEDWNVWLRLQEARALELGRLPDGEGSRNRDGEEYSRHGLKHPGVFAPPDPRWPGGRRPDCLLALYAGLLRETALEPLPDGIGLGTSQLPQTLLRGGILGWFLPRIQELRQLDRLLGTSPAAGKVCLDPLFFFRGDLFAVIGKKKIEAEMGSGRDLNLLG